jgi:hypothetical protein
MSEKYKIKNWKATAKRYDNTLEYLEATIAKCDNEKVSQELKEIHERLIDLSEKLNAANAHPDAW